MLLCSYASCSLPLPGQIIHLTQNSAYGTIPIKLIRLIKMERNTTIKLVDTSVPPHPSQSYSAILHFPFSILHSQFSIPKHPSPPSVLAHLTKATNHPAPFAQNKPNFQKAKIHLTLYSPKVYRNDPPHTTRKNKPNSNPIPLPPNFGPSCQRLCDGRCAAGCKCGLRNPQGRRLRRLCRGLSPDRGLRARSSAQSGHF